MCSDVVVVTRIGPQDVGVTSQREIENLVRSGEVKGGKLKLRMTLSAEGTPLKHVVEETVAL